MARPLSKTLLLWTRTLHIYATMLALILLMFFSFTGFMMNHGDWFGVDDPKVRESDLQIPAELSADKTDNHQLRMVEYLRKQGAKGAASYDDKDDDAIRVEFKEPGHNMDYEITRADGKAKLRDEIGNLMALMGDLHQGKSVGPAWHLVIDAASIFLMFAALSGLILWISLPKRRKLGIITLIAGIALCLAVYWFFVP